MRTRFLILAAAFSLICACSKEEKTERVFRNVSFESKPLFLKTLLPELEGLPCNQHNFYYIDIKGPDLEYSYNLGRAWVEAQDTTLSLRCYYWPIIDNTEEGGTWSFNANGEYSMGRVHHSEDLSYVDWGFVSGTLTLRISLPEDYPYDEVRIEPGSDLRLPSCIGVSSDDASLRIDGTVVSNKEEWVITRSGLTLEFNVTGVSSPFSGNLYMSGSASSVVCPESFDIQMVFSELEFLRLAAVFKDREEEEIAVSVPFQPLKEEVLNHFNHVKVESHYNTDDADFYFMGHFFSSFGGEIRTSKELPINRPFDNVFFDQPTFLYQDTLRELRLPQLDDLIKDPFPQQLGFAMTNLSLPSFLETDKTYKVKITNEWYIPLQLKGAFWGKDCQTSEITLSEQDIDAVPGTDIIISGWLSNRQPFNLECIPVIVFEGGKEVEFPEKKFVAPGGYFSGYEDKRFVVSWKAEDTPRPVKIYLKLRLLDCTISPSLASDQFITWGIELINKEIIAS